MKYYLFFSGGYDSTAILLKYCKYSSEENPVNIITCSHTNLDENKMIMERRSIDKILKHLRKMYFLNVTLYVLIIKRDLYFLKKNHVVTCQ